MRIKILCSHVFFMGAYILFVALRVINASLFQLYIPSEISSILRWIVVILSMLSIVGRLKFKRRQLYYEFVLAILGLLVFLPVRNADFFCVVMLMASAVFENPISIIRISAVENLIFLLFIILLCKLGVLEDYIYNHANAFGHGMRIAHSYGFTYYSNAAFMILFISIILLYFKNNVKIWTVLLIVNFMTFRIFTAKLPLVIFVMFGLIYLFIKYKIDLLLRFRKIMIMIPWIFWFGTLITCYLYNDNNRLLFYLNFFTNNRLYQGHKGIMNYGLSLFGQKIQMYGSYMLTYGGAWRDNASYFFIDNDYLLCTLVYGILFTAFLMLIFTFIIDYYIKKKNRFMLTWTFVSLIFAIINSTLINIELNPLLLVGLIDLFHNHKNKFGINSSKVIFRN